MRTALWVHKSGYRSGLTLGDTLSADAPMYLCNVTEFLIVQLMWLSGDKDVVTCAEHASHPLTWMAVHPQGSRGRRAMRERGGQGITDWMVGIAY